MSNFTFLEPEWPELFRAAAKAESYTLTDPRTAVFYARRALEEWANWLFDHDRAFLRPSDQKLIALLVDPTFKDNVPPHISDQAHLIRQMGNAAVHRSHKISQRDSLAVVKNLWQICFYLAATYTRGNKRSLPKSFEENRLPQPAGKEKGLSPDQLKALEQQLDVQKEDLAEKDDTITGLMAKIKDLEDVIARSAVPKQALPQAVREVQAAYPSVDYLKTELATAIDQRDRILEQVSQAKAANQKIELDHEYTEAETRTVLIDMLLREAGWDPQGENVEEYEVTGMPNRPGIGWVDYVLWGKDGKPLALVEAKRTSKDPRKGKQQAKLYADSLEKMHGRRPVIFYSNGFRTWLWDDTFYPPREVQGFYTHDELERLVQRRSTRKPLNTVPTNRSITERYYQEEAIRSVADHLEKRFRKSLLVMATGTGKTRVSISLVDVLMRANWVKRVLFLADRTSLVRQAVNAFKRHLPEANPVNLLEEKNAQDSRVVVSTYHTMMGLIDEMRTDGQKAFSVGHFDLVIIDEAHRSVYHKFGAIFDYFDSLLIGLTATPKDDVDKNTYRLFELEDGVPTYNYDLDVAVRDGFLVPPRAISVPLKFQREGISYDELSDEEKLEWELLDWGEEGEIPDRVEAAALNAWLFNEDTVDKVLQHLLENGVKVKAGDRLGKTIIFAKNHNHAEYIQERFDANYPHLAGHFARVIDNYQTYAHTLIDDFSKKEDDPHIAISVDMLDTGIDVPEVVNLVFFKLLRSKTKFIQMIGRGTRLCPDLFGPGQDKEHFIVFDYCQNFEFFNENPQGIEARAQEPLSQRIFKRRLDLLEQFAVLKHTDPEAAELADKFADELHRVVEAMPAENFIVRPKREYVDKFRERERWNSLSRGDLAELHQHVSGLPTQLPEEDEQAKYFDWLILDMQLALLEKAKRFETQRKRVMEIAQKLAAKTTIPMVNAQLPLLLEILEDGYWEGVTLTMLEHIRVALRDLVQFIDKNERKTLFTDFTDQLGEMKEVDIEGLSVAVDIAQYKKKVEQFVRSHQDERVIRKIRMAMPLTAEDLTRLEEFFFEADETGTREDFERVYGEQENLGLFIRSLVGLDRQAAKQAFAEYLDEKVFTADQIRFVNYIIEHLTANGTMDPARLYEQPYTNIHERGVEGVFPGLVDRLIATLRRLNTVG